MSVQLTILKGMIAMREVSKSTIQAFLSGKACKVGNTSVTREIGFYKLRLHGNVIATRNTETGEILVSDGGWQTNTTKERLNSLFSLLLNDTRIFQRNGVWFVDGINGVCKWEDAGRVALGGFVAKIVA